MRPSLRFSVFAAGLGLVGCGETVQPRTPVDSGSSLVDIENAPLFRYALAKPDEVWVYYHTNGQSRTLKPKVVETADGLSVVVPTSFVRGVVRQRNRVTKCFVVRLREPLGERVVLDRGRAVRRDADDRIRPRAPGLTYPPCGPGPSPANDG